MGVEFFFYGPMRSPFDPPHRFHLLVKGSLLVGGLFTRVNFSPLMVGTGGSCTPLPVALVPSKGSGFSAVALDPTG